VGAVLRLEEVRVLPVQDGLLQDSFTNAMPRPGLCRVGFPRRTLTDGRYSQAVFTRAA
jgi:hypothetical protein